MQALWKFLDGRKTYITAFAIGVAGVLLGLKIITQEQFNHFVAIAIPAAIAFIRAAIK